MGLTANGPNRHALVMAMSIPLANSTLGCWLGPLAAKTT